MLRLQTEAIRNSFYQHSIKIHFTLIASEDPADEKTLLTFLVQSEDFYHW